MPPVSDWTPQGDYSNLQLLRNGGAARIVLDRPEALNAWDKGLGDDLIDAIDKVGNDSSVRAVELRGAGKAFSSGADLKAGFDHSTPEGRPDLERSLHERYHPVIMGVRHMPKPVVAAVHGPAVGVSCALALACDLVLASDDAYFLLAFANIGLVPDGGASIFIPNRTGFSRAAEMAMLAEKIHANRALEWGLVNKLVAPSEFDSAADELLLRLANGPTKSYAGIKAQLNAQCFSGLEEHLALEAKIQQEQANSTDFIEGVTAFLERREAKFKGE
jgi:2-(1,2-epoxy-1,2-dihydrophenyl)acetyl-CoA isomerase